MTAIPVIIDNVPADRAGLCSLYAATQGQTVSQMLLAGASFQQLTEQGIAVASKALAATPSALPADIRAELETETAIMDAAHRILSRDGDLSAFLAAAGGQIPSA